MRECRNELIKERAPLCMNNIELKFKTLVWKSQQKLLVRSPDATSFKLNSKNIFAKLNFNLRKTEFLRTFYHFF